MRPYKAISIIIIIKEEKEVIEKISLSIFNLYSKI